MNLRKPLLSRQLTPAGVALLYATFAALWIVASGYLLTIAVDDPVLQSRIELAKGLVFVAVTSALLYLLLRVRGAANLQDDRCQPLGTMRLLLIFAALTLAVPLIGFAIARLYGPQIEREAYANLEVIARLKAEQIENWLDERRGDSQALADDMEFAELVGQFVQQGQGAKQSTRILNRFEHLLTDYHYTKILLLNTSGQLLLSSGDDVTPSPVFPGLWRQTLVSQQVQRRDIYRDEEGDIHLEWAVPLVVSDAHGKRAVAVVVLRVTAQRFIYPLIQTWPTTSASGETLLVRREGESVMFLNGLRHRPDTALKLMLPLTDAELPAAVAVRMAKPGTMQGKDYRALPVLAAYRPVTGTNWHIVAKIDRDEVLAPLWDLVLWVSLIALVAIVAVSTAVLLLWRQQQRAYQLEMRARSMVAIEESERHFHSLFENMLNGYAYCRMLYDDHGRPVDFIYLDVNAAFERITGLKNVMGKRVSVVIPGIRELSPELFETYGRVATTGIPETFEFDFKSQDQWYDISVYSTEKEHFVAVFDDITERKRSVRVLAESEQRFRGVVEQSLAGIYIIQDSRFVYVNPRFAEIFGYASVSELIGVEPTSLVAEQDRAIVAENIRSRIKGEVLNLSYGFTAVRKDGSLIDVGVHGARATHEGRPAIIGMMQDVSEKKRADEQIQHYVTQLEHAFMHTIEVATTLVEMRDPYTAGHEKRVALIAVAIGAEMGLAAHSIEGLRVGGYIHDIGKIIVPAEILSKPGKLSEIEYKMVRGHPQAGYDILKNVGFPWPVADIAYQHHERMDGSGYPRGLKGGEILLEARIIAVADVVEAMASHRPYRPGFGIEKALAEIERGSGNHYDPVVVAACLRLFREKGYELPV